ncbi:hypothetical protein Tco_1526306, partial [Tanacetum coccineum]
VQSDVEVSSNWRSGVGSELPVNALVSTSRPNQKASIPFPARRNDERRRKKANDQIEKFYEIFRDLSFEISFTDALMLMPKFTSTLKTLIGNKEKLSERAMECTRHVPTMYDGNLPRHDRKNDGSVYG